MDIKCWHKNAVSNIRYYQLWSFC